jgi:copper chaperone NosL
MNKIGYGAWCVVRNIRRNTQYAIRFIGLNIILTGLIACSGNTSATTTSTPPTLHYGEDVCEFCGMIISEERFAAAYVTADGHGHTFDDIGDMIKAYLKMQEDVTAFFVHDHESGNWVRAETAYFVLSQELPTPMFSGLAAFDSKDKANAFAMEVAGEWFTFEELLTRYRENPVLFLSGI